MGYADMHKVPLLVLDDARAYDAKRFLIRIAGRPPIDKRIGLGLQFIVPDDPIGKS